MSSAFRNFILTLVITLAVLGIAAVILVPIMTDALFGEESAVSDHSAATISEGNTPSAPDTSEEPSAAETDSALRFLLVAKNAAGHACAAMYLCVNPDTLVYTTVRFPMSMYLDDDGTLIPFWQYAGEKTPDELLRRASALVGRTIDYYIVAEESAFAVLCGLRTGMTATLPYAVRYLSPEFATMDPSELEDYYYITLPAGEVTLTSENIPYLLSAQDPAATSVSYSMQEDLCASLFRQLISATAVGANDTGIARIYASVKTNITKDKVVSFAAALFSYTGCTKNDMKYPTEKSANLPNVTLPNWSVAIRQITGYET